jgi:ricin-type beta-trefoil lectin protein
MVSKLCIDLRCVFLFLGLALGLLSSAGCGGGGTTGGSPIPPTPPITPTTPPAQPVDVTPINGEVYYVINQLSGLQVDLIGDSTTAGDHVIQQQRSFTDIGQRWAFTKLSAGGWQVSNSSSGFCSIPQSFRVSLTSCKIPAPEA